MSDIRVPQGGGRHERAARAAAKPSCLHLGLDCLELGDSVIGEVVLPGERKHDLDDRTELSSVGGDVLDDLSYDLRIAEPVDGDVGREEAGAIS